MRQRVAAAMLAALAGGGLLHLGGEGSAGDIVLAAGTALVLLPLTWSVFRSLIRRDVGVDAIALVAIAGALALQQWAAGAVIALMLAGGNALEERAGRRARRELTRLVERAPRIAHVRSDEGALEERAVDDVAVGDVVVVRAGEVVPVDGIVVSAEAVVDESSLTGEPLPVVIARGRSVRSGTANSGDVFELRAVRPARRAPMPPSFAWSPRPSPSRRRSSGSPTATRSSSCRLRPPSPRSPGRTRATRFARWRSSSSRRRAR
jgi:cation transport ATPase